MRFKCTFYDLFKKACKYHIAVFLSNLFQKTIYIKEFKEPTELKNKSVAESLTSTGNCSIGSLVILVEVFFGEIERCTIPMRS
jgi:hypothetical protein